MSTPINDEALDLVFRQARTLHHWQEKPVDDSLLEQIWNLTRLPPTAANCSPLRITFVRSAEAKARLKPCLDAGNVDKTMSAPVTAILTAGLDFYEQMTKLFPLRDLRPGLAANPEGAAKMATMNSTLQAGYFMLAARSLGLDCGPMGGFNAAKVDAEFFPDGKRKSFLLVNLGYGDRSQLRPRLPRLEFAEAATVL